ncbi:GNAT family N-acetyltransferase [Evansella halocellulosilytica]|uniref:GNAT family N-acetyltransferase n=1 Tax=Evansella halocellulosilytica TaxID=2011013 RepID=UPI000BB6AE2D|nr:GNAT family protein [Evansella halocellulosilytica]
MFISDRIMLRKVTEQDAETYYKWRNDPEVMQNTSPHLDLFTMSETEEFINSIVRSSTSKSYMIVAKESKQPIGIISLIHLDYKNRNAECIIDIGEKEYWGNGYGKEAMQLLLNYSFRELNLHKVYLRVFSFNERAIRLYEKIGFSKEGELKDQLYRNGKWYSIIHMAFFQKNYMKYHSL